MSSSHTWRNAPPTKPEISKIAAWCDDQMGDGAYDFITDHNGAAIAIEKENWREAMNMMDRLTKLEQVDDFLLKHRYVTMNDWRDDVTPSSEGYVPKPILAPSKLCDSRQKIRQAAQYWVDQLIEKDEPRFHMLAIAGNEKGTGKTMLEIIIARALAWSGRSVHIVRGHEMFRRIRDTFDNDSGRTEDVMGQYIDSDVLVIDDLGTHAGTDWELKTLAGIIDARYDYERPIVATTNAENWEELMSANSSYRASEAASRCASRFSEMGLWLDIPGDWPDMRRIARDMGGSA